LSFLAAAVLVAAVVTPKHVPAAEPVTCPSVAVTVAAQVSPTPLALRERTCSALEVAGRVAAGSLALDPSFQVRVKPEMLAHPVNPGAPAAMLQGFGEDGSLLFAFALEPSASFHLYLPVDVRTLSQLAALRLGFGATAIERTRAAGAVPEAEVIDADASHILVAWDGTRFPAVRILDAASGRVLGYGIGAGTYTQLTLETSAPRVTVEFSDGVRSAARTYPVFGR